MPPPIHFPPISGLYTSSQWSLIHTGGLNKYSLLHLRNLLNNDITWLTYSCPPHEFGCYFRDPSQKTLIACLFHFCIDTSLVMGCFSRTTEWCIKILRTFDADLRTHFWSVMAIKCQKNALFLSSNLTLFMGCAYCVQATSQFLLLLLFSCIL